MAEPKAENVIHLYCRRGWSYAKPNYVEAILNGKNVGGCVRSLMAASRSGGMPAISYERGVGMRVTHGESFNMEDFAEALSDVFALHIEIHDKESAE